MQEPLRDRGCAGTSLASPSDGGHARASFILAERWRMCRSPPSSLLCCGTGSRSLLAAPCGDTAPAPLCEAAAQPTIAPAAPLQGCWVCSRLIPVTAALGTTPIPGDTSPCDDHGSPCQDWDPVGYEDHEDGGWGGWHPSPLQRGGCSGVMALGSCPCWHSILSPPEHPSGSAGRAKPWEQARHPPVHFLHRGTFLSPPPPPRPGLTSKNKKEAVRGFIFPLPWP